MKKSIVFFVLSLISGPALFAGEIHVLTRMGGGTVIGCKKPVKGVNSLKAAARKRGISSMCKTLVKKTSRYRRYNCPKLQSQIWVIKGRRRCLQMKSALVRNKKSGSKLFGFFRKGRKLWGGCSPIIGFEGLRGATRGLRKPCGRPTRTDRKTFAAFYCKKHGSRHEYYFTARQKCKKVLRLFRKKARR